MKKIIFLLAVLLYFSCKNEKHKADTSKDPQTKAIQEPKAIEMIVYIDNLRVRNAPGTDSKELAKLPKETVVNYKGELSDFTSEIQLRGIKLNAPWLKIETTSGLQGWIYAGGVKPNTEDPSQANQTIDDIRIKSFFGENLTQQIKDYQRQWNANSTSNTFANTYALGEKIQEEVNAVLSDKVQIDDPRNLADMSWIERSLPGFQNSLVAEGTQFYLFKNFKQMHGNASKTKGVEDDDFIELQYLVNEMDSIEHFFKSYFIQTWDYGGHSLLGQGKHLTILNKINELLAQSKLFEEPILEIKTNLLKDILDEHITYWESKEKILDELSNLIKADFVFLSKEDKIALKTRLKMFEQPKTNKIEVNNRAF